MSEPDGPWMFLVRMPSGRAPQVFRVQPHELASCSADKDRAEPVRRRPHAWCLGSVSTGVLRTAGFAAVGNSVAEAFALAEALRQSVPSRGVTSEVA